MFQGHVLLARKRKSEHRQSLAEGSHALLPQSEAQPCRSTGARQSLAARHSEVSREASKHENLYCAAGNMSFTKKKSLSRTATNSNRYRNH